MTKKAAALLLAASLAVSVCATPVFAAEETGSHEGSNKVGETSANTEVTYRVDCSYTWTIPKKIDFGANAGVDQTRIVEAINGDKDAANKPATDNGTAGKGNVPKVRVTSNIINDDKTLHISIDTTTTTDGTTYDAGKKEFYVVTGTTDPTMAQKLYFTIAKSNPASTTWDVATQPVLTVPAGTPTGKQELRFTLSTANGGTAEKAGTYNGKVVFKSELKPTT